MASITFGLVFTVIFVVVRPLSPTAVLVGAALGAFVGVLGAFGVILVCEKLDDWRHS